MSEKIAKLKLTVSQNLTWICLMLLLFALSLRFPSDPDMGWHLRNGQDLLNNFSLIFAGDQYSWSMAGYPWVPHEWLTDITMAVINNQFGLIGLVVLFSVLMTFLFYFAAGIFKTNKITQAIIAILTLSVSYNIIGVRPQMITILGVVIILYLLFKTRNDNPKLIKWLPIIMLLWANLHGGFGIAFVIIATFVFAEFIRKILMGKAKYKKGVGKILSFAQMKMIGLYTGLGFLATLINPSGWKVYLEIYQTFSDRNILNSISEWLGVTLYHQASYNLVILTLIILLLLFINKWKVDITKLILVIIMFYFSLSAWRHVPIFAIVATPLIAEQFSYAIKDGVLAISKQFWMPLVVLIMAVFVGFNYYTSSKDGLVNEEAYAAKARLPYGAIEYIRENNLGDKLLNEYNWGGYLVWKYPEEKVFIDGRMAIWKWNGIEIFEESRKLLRVKEQMLVTEGLEEWGIDHILTFSNGAINSALWGVENWELKYQDNIATVWALKYLP